MKDWVGDKNSVFKTLGASNHTRNEREENDYYATDPVAIDALDDYFDLFRNDPIWEPACGEGHLTNRLRALGYKVVSSDLVNRMGEAQYVWDFFKQKEMLHCITLDMMFENRCKHIITNPPYKYALEFVLHSLKLLPKGGMAAFLLKTTFLEGQKRFEELFSKYPPKEILQFVRRIVCAKNGNFDGAPGALSYAWFIWEKGWEGNPIVRWVNASGVV